MIGERVWSKRFIDFTMASSVSNNTKLESTQVSLELTLL